jgi:signal transduction histidine kinase
MFRQKGSLARRNALVYFILFIVGISVTGIVLFSYSSREITGLTEKRLTHTTEMIRLKMMDFTDHLERDVNQLTNSPLLERYSNDTNRENLHELTQEYLSVLESKPTIFQIRLIEVSALGKEIIRVERKNDQLLETPIERLQFKGDRDYYQEMVQMPIDSLYFSKINLNREHTQISRPITPTLRIGKRILAGKIGEALLVINVDLNTIFTEMEQLLPENYELRVMNQDLHYLIHPDSSAEFTFEYDRPSLFLKEFSEETYLNHKGDWKNEFETDQAIYSRIEIPYGREGSSLKALVSAEKSIIFQSFYSWRNKVLVLILIVALVFLVLAFFYMRRQSKELNRITQQLSSFASSPSPMELPIKRKDEIGQLARSFEMMSRQISENQQLIEAERSKAEKAYEDKNTFLENMSHEIRNPLQAIIGTTDILEQNQLEASQEPFIKTLKFNANQLKSLVTDILDYSKIKAGQITNDPSWSRLDLFCEELVQSLGPIAQRKKINLSLELDETCREHHFFFDTLRLYQILNNLLNNALKFTPENGQVSLIVQRRSNEHLFFNVIDNGPGMPEEELSRILNRNYTSDYATGAGLGLTIVRELLVVLKSELQVASAEGEGSSFSFELPMEEKAADSATSQKDENLTDRNWAELKILVIEDDLELQNWYKHVFEKAQVTIISVPTEFVKAENVYWDVIITDLNFNGEKVTTNSGYLSQLMQNLTPHGLILIVSGNEGSAFIENEKNVHYLSKPVDRDKLNGLIDHSLFLRRFGQPDFSDLAKDYDHQAALIKNAIKILIQEWEKDRFRYKDAILNRNVELFQNITHKILANVKRLHLVEFQQLLERLEHSLIADSDDVQVLYLALDDALKFYLRIMSEYQQKLH